MLIGRARSFLTTRFFLSWGIVFVTLIGLASGLAQFFPQVKFTVASSGLLVLVVAAIGLGYALVTAKPVHIPPVLLPEEPATFSIECCTDRSVLLAVNKLAGHSYAGVRPLPPDRYEQWLMTNETILISLFNEGRELLGYFDVFPLQTDFLNLFIAGSCGEHDIRREHILSREQARFTKRLYLAGFAVRKPHTPEGGRCALMLFWGLLKYLQYFYCSSGEKELYAEGATSDGEDILKKYKFRLVGSASGRRDPHSLYAATITNETINHLLATRRDYSNICQLDWECKREQVGIDKPHVA
jgi:hypothetical protein